MTVASRRVRVSARRPLTVAQGDVYLHPGEFAVAANASTITTILGSCVGICLYDSRARIGGLNHFLLPRSPLHDPSPRYGDIAFERLLESLEALGARRHHLSAKVIGGACMLDAYRGVDSHIGRQNVRSALQLLLEHRIVVTSLEVGGGRARKVRFRTDTGDLVIRAI